MRPVLLQEHPIGPDAPVYVIAEIGGNFVDFEQGARLIDLAHESGCDAVKLQTFRADTLTTKKAMFDMENTGKVSQWELFRKYEIDEELHRQLIDHARKRGIFCFSTPSHASDVDLLERLAVGAYKIGSDDAVNLPLIRYVAQTGKPVLLSTGMCTMDEVRRSVKLILDEGNENIVVMHCTSSYPTRPQDANLSAIQTMSRELNVPIGYSDHCIGIEVSYAAAVLGASALEFHFTHDKSAPGPDHMLSKDPRETAELVRRIRMLPELLGDGVKRPMLCEMMNIRNNRKSIVTTCRIRQGEKITDKNVAIKRPGSGIPCEHWDATLGKTAARDLDPDHALTWEDVQ